MSRMYPAFHLLAAGERLQLPVTLKRIKLGLNINRWILNKDNNGHCKSNKTMKKAFKVFIALMVQ